MALKNRERLTIEFLFFRHLRRHGGFGYFCGIDEFRKQELNPHANGYTQEAQKEAPDDQRFRRAIPKKQGEQTNDGVLMGDIAIPQKRQVQEAKKNQRQTAPYISFCWRIVALLRPGKLDGQTQSKKKCEHRHELSGNENAVNHVDDFR